MRKKQLYEAPEAEALEVRFEENILESEVDGLKANPMEPATKDDHWGTF